ATRQLVDFVRRNRLPFVWRDTDRDEEAAACSLLEAVPPEQLPLVRLPGGPDLFNPSAAVVYAALGISLELAPQEEGDLLVVGVVGGGNSAGQAAVWLARGGALVTLLHRRDDLGETMSDYLIHELDRYGVAVRGRSEIVSLHGEGGWLEAVTLRDGERLPLSF